MTAPARGPLPTAFGIEHLSMTVPDLDEATSFFEDVFGCTRLYTMGPFGESKGSFIRRYANADVRSVVHHVRVLRSPFLNIELFDVTTPGQRPVWPSPVDIGGWQLGARVDDIDAAISWLEARGIIVLEPVKRPLAGYEGGDGFTAQCLTKWGFRFSLIAHPPRQIDAPPDGSGLWDPAQPDGGLVSSYKPRGGSLPTFAGFERVTIAVADLDEATALLEELLGCSTMAEYKPEVSGRGGEFGASANVDVRARPSRARVVRSPYLNFELIECPPFPGQEQVWRGMFDIGGWHLALYADDMGAVLNRLAGLDVYVLGGKKPAYNFEAGDDSFTLHGLGYFGLYFEVVSYPNGRYSASELPVPAWHPKYPTR